MKISLTTALTSQIESVLREKYEAKATYLKESIGQLAHELKVPIVAIRGAVDIMKHDIGTKKLLKHDYIEDILLWTELMGRLIDNADMIRYSVEDIPIRATRTNFLTDVVLLAIRQVKMFLKERNFSESRISYKGFEIFPSLWLDRKRFQQAVFNMLSNSIKYAFNDPNSFVVEIEGIEKGEDFYIYVRDYGVGIEADMKELIFEKIVRDKDANVIDFVNSGFGLWIVRRIIESHGGTIECTNLRFPTEFTIKLPSLLASQPFKEIGE